MRDGKTHEYLVPMTHVGGTPRQAVVEGEVVWVIPLLKRSTPLRIAFTPAPEFITEDPLTMLEREMIMAETRG